MKQPTGSQASLGQQADVVNHALAVLRKVSVAAPGSAGRAPRGSSAGHAGATPAASAWAALLVDLVRRSRDTLDGALATPSAADRAALHGVLQLSWALLDALASVRHGWKGDSFLAVGPAENVQHHKACLVPSPVCSPVTTVGASSSCMDFASLLPEVWDPRCSRLTRHRACSRLNDQLLAVHRWRRNGTSSCRG
jgi:hypothetical protein